MPIALAGLTRIGQGREAEVFALDDLRVIKVARDGAGGSLEREAAAMRAAHAAGMPVPAAQELLEIDGRRALIMGRAPGIDMLTGFARRPWTLLRAGSKIGRLHARLHETVAPESLPTVREVVERRVGNAPQIPTAARAQVMATLGELPDGDRLCHFDFHPANVITDGKTMTVIDWPAACRGDPLADVAATMIVLRGGKTAPGTPLITRLVAPLGRKLLLGGYVRGYRSARPFDRERFERWLVVLAGVRLSYGIAGEEDLLLSTIERGR